MMAAHPQRPRAPVLFAVVAALALGGCQTRGPLPLALKPLGQEGETHLYLQPVSDDADRLAFTLESVSAARADGSAAPLELALPEVHGAQLDRQRLLAWGRLEAGSYAGFLVKVKRATLAREEGKADLLVNKAPTLVEAPFAIAPHGVAVQLLSFEFGRSVGNGVEFVPSFTVAAPARPLPALTGLVSNAGASSVTVFDKRNRVVADVIPVGGGPAGMAIDPFTSRAYVALAGEDQIAVIDLMSGEELPRIRLRGGDRPRELLLSSRAGGLVAINSGSSSASFIELESGLEADRVPLGDEPGAVRADRSGQRAYVFDSRSNDIRVLDLAGHAVASVIRTDPQPIDGRLNRAGDRLYVIHRGSPYMTVFSVPNHTVVSRVLVGPGTTALALDPNTDLVYVAAPEGRVAVFHPFSELPIDHLAVPAPVSRMVVDDAENTLHVLMPDRRSVAVVNLSNKKLLSEMDVGPEPFCVSLSGERY